MTIMVKLSHPPLELAFEVGSFSEAVGVLESEKGAILRAFGVIDENSAIPAGEPIPAAEPAKTRGRKPKNQPDPATASAPPPAPVPTAAPTPPPAAAAPAGDLSIPAFLQRPAPTAAPAAAPAVAAPPPPPPIPAAPPVVPAAPSFVLGNKVADELQTRKNGSVDAGKALHDWLMPNAPFLIPGATLDEAIAVLRLTADEKVEAIAKALQVA